MTQWLKNRNSKSIILVLELRKKQKVWHKWKQVSLQEVKSMLTWFQTNKAVLKLQVVSLYLQTLVVSTCHIRWTLEMLMIMTLMCKMKSLKNNQKDSIFKKLNHSITEIKVQCLNNEEEVNLQEKMQLKTIPTHINHLILCKKELL